MQKKSLLEFSAVVGFDALRCLALNVVFFRSICCGPAIPGWSTGRHFSCPLTGIENIGRVQVSRLEPCGERCRNADDH